MPAPDRADRPPMIGSAERRQALTGDLSDRSRTASRSI